MSAASAMFFLKPKFLQIKTGELYEFLASKLISSPRFSSSKINFTLVNIFSRPSSFSRGVSKPPPEDVCPANRQLTFTFAYDLYDDPNEMKLTGKNKRSNSVSQFGNRKSQSAFTTIGLTGTECARFGCHALYTEHLAYLYNILGVMTKSLAKFSRFYEIDSYDAQYDKGLKYLKEGVGSSSLYKILTSTPYYLWVFNPLIWRYAPNLLTSKMITAEVALYYFAELHTTDLNRLSAPAKELIGFPTVSKNTILDHLSNSLIRLIQSINTSDTDFESAEDVLAPAVVDSLVSTGHSKIELDYSTDSRLWGQLRQRAAYMVKAFEGPDTNLGQLFMPVDHVAQKMFSADAAYTDKLVQNISFS